MRQVVLKILIFVSVVLMGAGVIGGNKIALIGDSEKTMQLADLVMAELSGKLYFLERSEIEKVLKEHKLYDSGLISKQIPIIAKILHTDIFAVLSSAQVRKKTIPSSLRVFDARNGFCLVDTALPAGMEQCAKFVGSKLKSAIKILSNPQSLKFVSILAVRNAGAPVKYKRQMAHIAIELERRLIAMPDVAVLERSELGLVNKERKITKKLFKLASSAYLLDLEFAPTSSVDKIDLRIYILNASGKELASFNFPDCLKTKPRKIIKVLAKYLKTIPPLQVASNKEEAKRFFREYEFFYKTNKRKIAKCKLDATISLCPDNPDYIYALAKYIGSSSNYSLPPRQKKAQRFMFLLNIAKESMKIYDEIKKSFPHYKRILYRPILIRKNVLYDIEAFEPMRWIFVNNNDFLNEQQKKEIRIIMAEFRSKFFPEALKYKWKFNLDDGIKSSEELNHLVTNQNDACRIKYFFDHKDYIDFSYIWVAKCLQASSSFLKKNPKYIKTYNYVPSFFPGDEFLQSSPWEKSIKGSHAIVKIAKEHPVNAVKNYAYSWELYEQSVKERFDPEKFRTSLKTHLSSYKMFPDKFEMTLWCRQYPKLYKILKEEKNKFEQKRKEFTSLDILLSKLKVEKDIEKLANVLISHPPDVLKLRKRCNNELSRLVKFGQMLTKKDTAVCQKALRILNLPFVMKKMKNKTHFGNFVSRYARFKNAVMKDGKIYLLLLNLSYRRARIQKNKDFLKIYCFNPKKNSLNEVGMIKESPFEKLYVVKSKFLVSTNNFLFSAENQILIIPRDGSPYYSIKDLPAKRVMAMTIMNERIYAFLGYTKPWGNKPPSETILFSCLLDGSDRKIHISTSRRKKQHFFDKQKPFLVTNLIADEKRHRLLFTAKNSVYGFWEFYPLNGNYKAIIKFDRSGDIWSMKRRNKVYVAGKGNYNNYYIFDLKSEKLDFLFYSFVPSNIKYMKIKPRFAKKMKTGKPPFVIREKEIWNGGFQVRYIGIAAKKIFSQYIFGIKPYSHKIPIFPHSDGRSIWAIGEWAIYKITPPKIKKIGGER